MENELQIKMIKVSQKGQIAIPLDIRNIVGIKKGDKLMLTRRGKKSCYKSLIGLLNN